MAILLVCNRNESRADPARDRMAVKRWTPIAAFPDGYQFNVLELDTSRFLRIHVDALDHTLLTEAIAAQMEDDAGVPTTRPFRWRRWRIDPTLLPAAAQTALANTGVATITRRQLRNAIVRVRDGAAFTAL